MKSLQMTISGRVQGVFFRANVRKKALELELKGYAKNLRNGNVEIAAQGDEEKISELTHFIKSNPGAAKIKEIKTAEREPDNFKGFEIKVCIKL